MRHTALRYLRRYAPKLIDERCVREDLCNYPSLPFPGLIPTDATRYCKVCVTCYTSAIAVMAVAAGTPGVVRPRDS